MFCPNCGTELPNDASFCAQCGTKVDPVQTPDTVGIVAENIVNGAKKVKPIYYMIGAAVVVVLIAAICIGNVIGKTVDLNDYAVVVFEGYDTRGKAHYEFDAEAFEEDYGEKIKDPGEEAEFFGLTGADLFIDSLSHEIDKTEYLSNGDEVTLVWDIDKDALKKEYGLRVKAKDQTFTVSGLEEIATFDPFEGVELSFAGLSPYGTATLDQYPSDNGLYYQLSESYDLANGDAVTLSVSYSWDEDSYIAQYGKLPSSMEKEYTVEGLDEYVSAYADIDATLLEEMKKQSEDVIYSYAAKNYGEDIVMSGLEYAGYLFYVTKPDSDHWNNYNGAYLFFKGNLSSPEDKFAATDVYYPVGFSNLIRTTEGMSYEDIQGISGYTNLPGTWYTISGYINPLLGYLEIGEKRKDQYDIECGGGIEKYQQYALVSGLADIDDAALSHFEELSKAAILQYVADNYSEESHADELTLQGCYFLLNKEQGTDYASNNRLIVVISGHVYNDSNKFEATTVYFPVEFDGLVKLPDQMTYIESKGILGRSRLDGFWYTTNGYLDGATMYSELITSHRDKYTYEISENLKVFGE